MLKIKINSYDQHWDTYACTFTESDCEPFESLIPAAMMPYVAPELVALSDGDPYGLVFRTFVLKDAQEALGGAV